MEPSPLITPESDEVFLLINGEASSSISLWVAYLSASDSTSHTAYSLFSYLSRNLLNLANIAVSPDISLSLSLVI